MARKRIPVGGSNRVFLSIWIIGLDSKNSIFFKDNSVGLLREVENRSIKIGILENNSAGKFCISTSKLISEGFLSVFRELSSWVIR